MKATLGQAKKRGRMKIQEKALLAAVLVILMAAVHSCNTTAGGVLNYIRILGVSWSYESSEDGAQLLLWDLAVRFANDTGAPAEGKVLAEWGNGRTEESSISLPATGGSEYRGVVWTDNMHGDHYMFQGEKTVTIKLTIQFLDRTSPVYEKTVTMKSL
jgi:hypothetical protein